MALIEYDLKVGKDADGKVTYEVTYAVLKVDKGDKIRFKSNATNTAIRYKTGTPFKERGAPEADIAFKIGKTTTKEFKVAKPIVAKERLHFECGFVGNGTQKGHVVWGGDTPGFHKIGKGQGTPPGGTRA